MFPIRIAVPTPYPPSVTWALIVVNCAVFLFQISLRRAHVGGFVVGAVRGPLLHQRGRCYGIYTPDEGELSSTRAAACDAA
jgi:membrane associated rhomboid family serine protease